MRGVVISTLNNKLIFRTKGGTKITWPSISHIEVGEEVFFFVNTKGKVIKVEPVSCKHHANKPAELYVEDKHHIDYSDLDSEHDEVE